MAYSPSTAAVPSFADVRKAVRAALYSPDPMERSEAAADLILWGLPVDPGAVILAAERLAEKTA